MLTLVTVFVLLLGSSTLNKCRINSKWDSPQLASVAETKQFDRISCWVNWEP